MTRRSFPPILALTLMAAAAQGDHPGTLPSSIETIDFDYDIFFDASNPWACGSDVDPGAGDDGNYMPIPQAQNMADALDSDDNPVPGFPPGYHVGYTNLGFLAPDFDGEGNEVLVYDCAPDDDNPHEDDDCDNGRATFTRIIMPSTRYCGESERNVRRVMGHELFHHIEQAYTSKVGQWGKVAWEGIARMMEDQVYADIDGDEEADFDDEAGAYLQNPNQDFWRSSYRSALAWKYMAEQFGTVTTEPQVGVNFIRKFWENVDDNDDTPDLAATIDDTLDDFDATANFRDVFYDFTVANVAKQYDPSALPDADRYFYIDDNDGTASQLANVARTWSGDITTAFPAVSAVARWGAQYFEAQIPTGCIPGWIMGYRVGAADDARHTVLAIDNAGKIERMIKGGGERFAVAFLQQNPPLYSNLIAVITGGEEQIAFDYEFDCGPGNLFLRLPNVNYQAYVGPPDDPRKMIVRVQVSGPSGLGGPTVLGLQAEDFDVFVGVDAAQVLSGAHVLDEYWLTVQPPAKPDTATYDLRVEMDGGVLPLVDTNANAVSYEERVLDLVLVVDRSGSMGDPAGAAKIVAAKNAARLFADVVTDENRLGLASFSDDAIVDVALDDATGAHRGMVKTAINALLVGGGTSIGDGVDVARLDLQANGSAVGEDWAVLLSDGMENQPNFWNGVRPAVLAQGMQIDTIALGADADQTLLQDIASETGGQYYYVDADSSRGPAASIANSLADIYASSVEHMRRLDRLWEESGHIGAGGSTSHVYAVAGDGIADAGFLVNWDDDTETLDVEVRRPDGTAVVNGVGGASIRTDATHVVIEVDALTAGDWTVNLRATVGTPDYIAILSGRDVQGAELSLRFGQNDEDTFADILGGLFLRGLPQPVIAELVDHNGPVLNATVTAAILHPDGTTILLPLLDDGRHGDSAANDGLYANHYTRTTAFSLTGQPDVPGAGLHGSYNVTVNGQGVDNFGNAFTRIRKRSFQVLETDGLKPSVPPSDLDEDDLPDRYEELHKCLNPAVADSAVDDDQNGLSSLDEYLAGYLPCHPDTDRGGETDVSEAARGANPFDPADDALPRPVDPEIVDYISEHLVFPAPSDLQPNSLLIRYPVHPTYSQMRLLRKTLFGVNFLEVAVFDAQAVGGLYRDTGLLNGFTYDYKIQPIDASGNLGTPSHIFSGVPKLDPVPPIGGIVIDDGAAVSTSNVVNLSYSASADTVNVKTSNDPNFVGAPWTAFKTSRLNWALDPDLVSGSATVYVIYRDAAGNVSPTVYFDSIKVVPVSSVGAISGSASLAASPRGAVTVEGIVLRPTGPSDSTLAFTDAGGAYRVPNLPGGRYDLEFSYPGYQTASLEGIRVRSGFTTRVNSVTLQPVDSDGDGIADFDDNCTDQANADQRDTNHDGIGNACDTDLDDNCLVNFRDLQLFSDVFFSSDADADFNGDGNVNFLDLQRMRQQFFGPPGPSGVPNDCDVRR